MSTLLRKLRLSVLLLLLLLIMLLAAAAGGAIVISGIYNVAATEQHTALVNQFLEFAMRRSVKLRSHSVDVPELANEERQRNGLRLYRASCLQCHGAPGVAPEPFAAGMTPAPANLVDTARHWKPQEIYWVVRQGTKMTGMPAWEYRLTDAEIWDVVAFVMYLPRMSTKDYAQWNESIPVRRKDGAVVAVADKPGDPEAGRRAMGQYLCATCHQIPGVVGANKHVGPPLNGMATRRYIGGVIPNTPDMMVRWLQDPKQFDPLSAMPALGITDKDARDMAAYLYTLDDVE